MRESKKNIYFWGGINGTGKSFLLSELERKHDFIQKIGVSSLLMEKLGIPKGRYDLLTEVSEREVELVLRKSLADLINQHQCGTLFLDMHYYNYKDGLLLDKTGGVIPLVDRLFVVVGNLRIIYKRIKQDTGRVREIVKDAEATGDPTGFLEQYQKATIDFARHLGKEESKPVHVIDNSGTPEESLQQIREVLTLDGWL